MNKKTKDLTEGYRPEQYQPSVKPPSGESNAVKPEKYLTGPMTYLEADVFKLKADVELLAKKVDLLKTVLLEMAKAHGNLVKTFIERER